MSEIESCKDKPNQQAFCNDKNCGNRDPSGYHWPAAHPMNRSSQPELTRLREERDRYRKALARIVNVEHGCVLEDRNEYCCSQFMIVIEEAKQALSGSEEQNAK